MTNDDQHNHEQDGDIPELHDRLTVRLSSPSPEAIRGEAARRSENKRQTLMAVGAAVVVVVIAVAGIFALGGDDVAETATAGATDSASDRLDAATDAGGAVANDSSPREVESFDPMGPGTIPPGFPDPGQNLVLVPDFSNMHRDEALEQIEMAGFATEINPFPVDDPGAEGRVVGQLPEAGALVPPGTTVGILVGELGPRINSDIEVFTDVVVPDLTGMEFNEALNVLFELDFRTSRIDEPSSDVPAGTVIRTEPAPGTELTQRSVVTIVVSSGLERVVLPNVEGLLNSSAQQTLGAEGFEVNFVIVPTDDPSSVGRVITQDPAANTEVAPRSLVTISLGGLSLFDPVLIDETGAGAVWLDADGTLYSGGITAQADIWEVEQSYFDALASLTTVAFDDRTTAIILGIPIPDEPEDPPNVFQIFLVGDEQLNRVFNSTIGAQHVTPTFPGNGTMSYIEDGLAACFRVGFPDEPVALQRVSFSLNDGQLVETARQNTADVQDCNRLAG